VRGLVASYAVFVINPFTSCPSVRFNTESEAFVVQTMRHLTDDVDGVLLGDRLLICDRDRKWSAAVERFLATAGTRTATNLRVKAKLDSRRYPTGDCVTAAEMRTLAVHSYTFMATGIVKSGRAQRDHSIFIGLLKLG
jgi:hypothetical protein